MNKELQNNRVNINKVLKEKVGLEAYPLIRLIDELFEAQARVSYKEGLEAGRKEHEQELKIADERWKEAERRLSELQD